MSHTPGPWTYQQSKIDGEFYIQGANGVLPVLGRTHNWPGNAEANAQLMAAAPDLLEACHRSLKFINDLRVPQNNVDVANQVMQVVPLLKSLSVAISKATGR